MSTFLEDYPSRSLAPWANVAFVTPIVLAYEIGLSMTLHGAESRTGADGWLRQIAEHLGVAGPFVIPGMLMIGLVAWAIIQKTPRWRDPVGAWVGMVIESLLAAGLLFLIVQILFPALAFLGNRFHDVVPATLNLSDSASPPPEWTWEMIVRYLGAGLYEETIFRLIGFSFLAWLLRTGDLDPSYADIGAAFGSALAFAAAHHFAGEAVHATIFLYRVLAGLFFAGLFRVRGFGIAVGTHVAYDILVGLVLR